VLVATETFAVNERCSAAGLQPQLYVRT
jgi:hypothetical protein